MLFSIGCTLDRATVSRRPVGEDRYHGLLMVDSSMSVGRVALSDFIRDITIERARRVERACYLLSYASSPHSGSVRISRNERMANGDTFLVDYRRPHL